MRLTFLIMALLLVGYAGNTSAQISNIEDEQLTWSWINPDGQSMDGYATKQEAVAAMQASCTVCPELVLEGKKTVSEDQTRYEYTSKKIPPVPSDEWVYPAIKLLLVFSRGVPEFSTLFTTGEEQNAHTQAVQLDPADSVCGDNYIAPDGGWLPALPPSQGGNLVTFEPEYYQQYLSVSANSVFADVEWNEQWKVGSWNWEEEVAGQNYCFGPGSFLQDYAHLRLRALVCEEPYIEPLERMCILPEKAYIISLRNSECDETESNPCNPATGAKLAKAIDITTGDLQFVRHYNSRGYSDAGFGENWTHNYYKRLTGGTSTGDDVSLVTGSGQQMNFPYSQAQTDLAGQGVPVYTSVDSRNISIAVVPSTYGIQSYFLRQPNGVVERYDEYGRLTQIDDRGVVTDITYSREGLMTKISTDVGHSLNFTYNPDDTISQIATGSGEVYNYAYQQNTLASVTYPSENGAGVTRQYHYENANFKYHLTGITDENQQRFGTYGYDTAGRTILSEHAQTTNGQPQHQFTFSYEGIGQTLVTDPDGTQQRWTFSRNKGFNNAVQKQNLTDNKSRLQSFDSNNNLLERIDPEGRTVQFSYNAHDQMVSKTIAAGTAQQRQISYEYASPATGLVTRITEPSVYAGESKVTQIDYNDSFTISGITVNGFSNQGSAVSRAIALEYNERGKLIQIDGPRTDVNDISSLSYYDCTTGAECGQLQQVTNALGHSVSFDSYDADARLTQMTDANGVVTQLSYYPRGWIKQMTRSAAGQASKVTNYQYDAMGQVTQISLPDGVELNYSYDAAHELRSVSDNLGNRIEYTYDTRGNRTEHKVIDPDNSLVNQINLHYDQRNYVSQISSAGSIGQIVNDASGNPIGFTDPLENPDSGYQHDALSRLQQTVDALGNTTDYDYNVADQVVEVQAPNGATTRYDYDDLGNLLKEISPDRGTTTYAYDAAGNVISMTDARGVIVNYQYDELNRIVQVSYPTVTENILYQYDNCQNGIDRLCQISDESGVTTYEYDPWGNVTQTSKQEIDNTTGQGTVFGTFITQYQYDVANRISQITYPGGRVVNYQRDAIGRIDGVSTQVPGESVKDVLLSRTYRADGQWTEQEMGNGLVHSKTYDQQGRLASHIAGSYSRTYQYDANGNILGTSGSLNIAYEYDPLNRLTEEMDSISNATIQLTYDENGNRTSENDDRRVEPGHSIPTGYLGPFRGMSYESNSNRLYRIQNAEFIIDASGRAQKDFNGRHYAYNGAGRVKRVQQGTTIYGEYTYGADQLRTRKEVNGVTTIYHYDLAGNMLAESDSQTGHAVDYIYADGERIALKTETAVVASAPVEVNNLALGEKTKQSSSFSYNAVDSSADLAVDGNTDGHYVMGSVAITNNDYQAWWQVELDAQANIGRIRIHNRTEASEKLKDFYVLVSDSSFRNKSLATLLSDSSIDRYYHAGTLSAASLDIPFSGVNGRYVRIQLTGTDHLQLAEVEVLEAVASSGSSQNDPVDNLHYYINDHLGTPQRTLDESQVITWQAEYEAFGQAIVTRQIIVNNHRFPGQYYDAETGLHYNWHRYYNAEIGRYVTSDPIGLGGGMNTYAYVYGNPLKYVDRSGLEVTIDFDKGSGIVSVTDNDTGATHSTTAFSGGEGTYAAAPNGNYTVSHFPWLKPGYYSILLDDGRLDDFADGYPSNYNPNKTMAHLRFHCGYASHGCVTVEGSCDDSKDWEKIDKIIRNTKRGADITIGGQTFPNYGQMKITGEGYGKRAP